MSQEKIRNATLELAEVLARHKLTNHEELQALTAVIGSIIGLGACATYARRQDREGFVTVGVQYISESVADYCKQSLDMEDNG